MIRERYDMKNGGFKFRKSINGFNKEDVIKYISDEDRARRDDRRSFDEALLEKDGEIREAIRSADEEKAALEEQIAKLDARCIDLETARADVEEELEIVKESLEKLRAERDGLKKKLADMSAELDAKCEELKAKTLEFEAVKAAADKETPCDPKTETRQAPPAREARPDQKVNLSFKSRGFGFFRRGKGAK